MATFALPMAQPKANLRQCGECQACCSWFPLLPNPDFWPEGKPAQQPCRYLCAKGCSIHDQPRPEVCTGFKCAYLTDDIPWRPDQIGVIFSAVPDNFFRMVKHPECFPSSDGGVMLVEGHSNAIVQLEAAKVRYYLGKRSIRLQYLLVLPYGTDIHNHKHGRLRTWPGLLVLCDGSSTYAEQLNDWWQRN